MFPSYDKATKLHVRLYFTVITYTSLLTLKKKKVDCLIGMLVRSVEAVVT